MFYIQVVDNEYIVSHKEHQEGFIEVDDDIQNFDLYLFNAERNEIIKRKRLESKVESEGQDVLVHFDCDTYLGVEVTYLHHIDGESAHASSMVYLKSEDGVATLRLSIELFGYVTVTCFDEAHYFDRIEIDSAREIDNEHSPVVKVKGNHLTVGCSVNYSRFRSLQKEIESIKKVLADSGLVVTNE